MGWDYSVGEESVGSAESKVVTAGGLKPRWFTNTSGGLVAGEEQRRRQEWDPRDGDAGQPKDGVGDVIDAVPWPRAAWSQAMVSNA